MSPQKNHLDNYTSLRRQNLGHWWHALAFQGHRKGNIQKNLISRSFRKVFVFNYVKNRLSICFRRKKRLIKSTFTKTELVPSSHSWCCGEADCNRVHLVHQTLAPALCAGGDTPGTWQGHGCPSDPALPLYFFQVHSSLAPVQMVPCLLLNLLILSQYLVF